MEQFTKLPRWGQLVVTLLFCGLFFGAAWFLFLSDQRTTLQSRREESEQLEGQIQQGREALRRVEELNRQIELIARDLEVLKSIIPVEPETGKLLRVFQSYARDQNLGIYRISPQDIAKHELYSEQGYALEVGGGYHDLALFFDKIAHMRRIVNIAGLQMSADQRKGGTITAKFRSVVYMQNPEAFQGLEKKS